MTKFVNRAKVYTATTGTGNVTLGLAVLGYQTFVDAGVADADIVRYTIEDGTDWEIGTGIYSAAGNTLTRSVTESSNAGSLINLTGAATIYVTAAADDLLQPQDIGITVQGYSAALQGTTASYTTALNSKLNGIEAGATADQTASEILTAIKTVDGTGTGLDADLLDGQHGTYYTGYTDTAIANLVATAPATLDTLNELATALGNDPNFATTVTTSIGTKAASAITISAGAGMTGGGDLTANRTIAHADTSTQASLTALTGANVISDVDVDTYGHVTAMATRTMTAADLGALTGNQTITLSGDLTGSGTTAINAQLAANVVGANELNVVGNGTTAQYLRSDGDGTFTWATPTDTNTTYTAGTALSLVGTTFNNTAPDQTVTLTQGGATTITGTYPNFTISSTDTNTTYSVGNGGLTEINFTTALNNKLAGIEAGATADQTAAEILTAIKTVDGAGSGLDADLLDGLSSASFLRADANTATTGYLQAEGFVNSAGGSLSIFNPQGASYANNTGTVTGAIKITLPQSWTSTMMRMTIRIYEYATNESFDVFCGGYNYSPSSTWISPFAYILGSPNVNRNFNVRFGHDGSNCCVYIGETTSTWTYPQVAVTHFVAGFSNYDAEQWNDNWSVGFATTLGTITATITNSEIGRYLDGNVVWHGGNDGSGSGLDADLLDGQHGSYYQPASTAITTSNIGSQSVSYAATAGSAAINGVFYENNQTVTANYTITNGKNAMTAGPVTINAGVIVTIPSGSRWVVV